MRRFSQRSSLVTLSEINITPLLDLAFVLLIIFIITTPLLEKGLDLKLPIGGKSDAKVDKRDIRTVEISPQGGYSVDKRPMKLDQLAHETGSAGGAARAGFSLQPQSGRLRASR
jgi:biopolymer transport protein ExbD